MPRKLLIFFPQLVDFGCLSKTLPLRMKNNWVSESVNCVHVVSAESINALYFSNMLKTEY